MPSIPIILLTGHLGAGKTTLLNRLMQLDEIRGRRIALIVNEFGQYGVDGARVEHDGVELFELNHGSLFCACVTKDFLKTLDVLATRIQPDLVLIEATGVAETGDLVPLLERDVADARFHVHANLAVVDSLNFTKVLPFMQAAGRQVRQADGLVVSKTDRLSEDAVARLDELLVSLNADAPIRHAAFGDVPYDFIERAADRRAKRTDEPTDATLQSGPPRDVVSVFVQVDRVDRDALISAVERLGRNLLRMKGYVDFGRGPVFVESVFGEISESPFDENSADAPKRWKYGLTAIGWQITTDQLRTELSQCEM